MRLIYFSQVTAIMHFPKDATDQANIVHMLKNLAIIGGLIALMADRPKLKSEIAAEKKLKGE